MPFDLPQFKEALSQSRLQSPSTSKSLAKGEEFAGFSAPGRFYVGEDGSTMVLATQTKGRDRSEIRHNAHWSVMGEEKRFTATLRFDKPETTGKAGLTFMQIHIKDFLGNDRGPLLMVQWRSPRGEESDHLWAKVRQDFVPKDKKNKFYDLGPRPTDFFTLDVRVKEGVLRLFIDDKMLIEQDVSAFAEAPCYFKTGAYGGGLPPMALEYKSLSITTP